MVQEQIGYLNLDVFYSNKDITSLRWITEIKNELKKYYPLVNCHFHELNSEYAKERNISTELILLNNKKILYQHLKSKIKHFHKNLL